MLINFEVIVSRYGKPKGIIHIGAHLLQERNVYLKYNLCNTIWIEANPKIVENIKENIALNKDEQVLNYAITDSYCSTVNLHIASFDQSSSLLNFGTHKNYYPQISMTETIEVSAARMDRLINEYNISMDKYNFVNLDIQGAELLALKSFGNHLNKIDYVYTEVNQESLYEGCCLLSEIDDYLAGYNFKRVEQCITSAKWGDAFYIKK